MEAPEYYENVRLADVFARDAAHLRTLAEMANTIALGIQHVASIGATGTTRNKAFTLAADLRELAQLAQTESGTYRSKNAA